MLTLILLVFAFVCFALSAVWNPGPPRFNLLSAGLAFWVLAELLGHAGLKY
jgi:lipopolysaccharide export LptBFGC system permease protein LptF